MKNDLYNEILAEMNNALNDFSLKSSELNAYDYELRFRELTDIYNGMLFQASVGKVPISKNEKKRIQTSFGKIDVKKKNMQ